MSGGGGWTVGVTCLCTVKGPDLYAICTQSHVHSFTSSILTNTKTLTHRNPARALERRPVYAQTVSRISAHKLSAQMHNFFPSLPPWDSFSLELIQTGFQIDPLGNDSTEGLPNNTSDPKTNTEERTY